VNFDFSQHFRCELKLYLYFYLSHISVIFTLAKFLNSLTLILNKKSADFEEDVNSLEDMQHAHYPTADHVTTPLTYKYLHSVRCIIDTQNTKYELHTATVFDYRDCGSNRTILAGLSAL
jgi:hypothetical protein